MYGYIYKTTNLVNHKFYIGQHKSKAFDKSYFGSGILILKAFEKYGIDNFKCELIEECDSKQTLNEREKFWIKKLKPQYNISIGGNGGNLGEIINKKISETLKIHWKTGKIVHHPNSGFKKGYIPWNKGKEGTFKGKHHTKKARQKMSERMKGRTISLEQRMRHSEKMKGHFCSEKTRQKMSEHAATRNPIVKEKARINRMKNLKKKRWMTNGKEDKLIILEEVNIFLNNGWRIGRIKARGDN